MIGETWATRPTSVKDVRRQNVKDVPALDSEGPRTPSAWFGKLTGTGATRRTRPLGMAVRVYVLWMCEDNSTTVGCRGLPPFDMKQVRRRMGHPQCMGGSGMGHPPPSVYGRVRDGPPAQPNEPEYNHSHHHSI
jgi:hypothetical protein